MDDLFLFNATILKNRFDLSQTNIHIKNGIIHSVDFDNIDEINKKFDRFYNDEAEKNGSESMKSHVESDLKSHLLILK